MGFNSGFKGLSKEPTIPESSAKQKYNERSLLVYGVYVHR
jgi:hypothetical protein